MTATLFVSLAWTLAIVAGDSCSTKIIVDPSSSTDCSQALKPPFVTFNQTVCNDLQPALLYIQSLGISTGQSCIQVDISPGTYVVTTALIIQQNLTLCGIEPGVVVSFNITADQSSTFYAIVFLGASSATLSNIHFTNSPGILGFENMTTVSIIGCSFSYFLQGAVDIYNCGYPTITNCTFQNNGPTYIIKTQRYRGHSGGLSVGYNYDSVIGYNPLVLVSNSTFINNSVMTRLTTDTQVLQNRIFTGRGGGASIIINAADSVFALVEDCYFGENSALTLGGGLYTIPDGLSNHTIIVNRTKFINNRSLGGGGGLQQVYINPGSLSRLLSVLTYNCDFIGNTATVGGAIYQFLTGYVPVIAEVGNYGHFENCFFQANMASRFGAAIAVSSALLFGNRERIKSIDVVNCTFRNNIGLNKAGIVSVAYFAAILQGLNQFIQNSGSALTIVGSVVHLSENSILEIFNTTNAVDETAMSFLSLGQAVLYPNINVYFLGNSGSLGASIFVENVRYLPMAFQQVIYNPICPLRYIYFQESPLQWGYNNISVVFDSNTANVGAAIYTSNAAVCSWLRLSDPFFNTTEFYRTAALSYRNNRNIGHFPQDYNTIWDVQTKPVSVNIQNSNQTVEAYPGQEFALDVSASDEFNFTTVAVVQLIDSGAQGKFTTSKFSFSQSATVISNLTEAAFQTSFNTLNNTPFDEEFEVVTLFTTVQHSSKFTLSRLPCPAGRVLVKQATSYYTCECNSRNPYITDCRDPSIILKNGLWASKSNSINSYGDTIQGYKCPAGYCRCQVNSGLCETVVDFETPSAQCSCLRLGVLCGDCAIGNGVSALCNRCVTCNDGSGVLIALLVAAVALIFISLVFLSMNFPSWLFPSTFYLQLLPFVTEHFPVTFETTRPYLYYVSSGLSFYFVYDFCLYSNMSPLVSYFIRYLPLFTAIIVCPIVLIIRKRTSPHAPWHGLWWIVVLMYTHVVHTSMSILNCPRLPRRDGNIANVWYINGNIECFTGWHIPLAILAMLVLILCVASIPMILLITTKNKIPRWTHNVARCIIPALAAGYKDELKWFGSVELFRKLITMLFIVALPGDEYSSIFLIIIIIAIYGYIQPYKLILSNILEIVTAVDVLILLFLKNTNQIRDTLEIIPEQPVHVDNANNSTKCMDNDNIKGLSSLVQMLTVLYYLPLLILVVGAAIWTVYKLRFSLTRKLNKIHRHSKQTEKFYSLLEYSVGVDDPVETNQIELSSLKHALPDDGQSAGLTTPYVQQESPIYL